MERIASSEFPLLDVEDVWIGSAVGNKHRVKLWWAAPGSCALHATLLEGGDKGLTLMLSGFCHTAAGFLTMEGDQWEHALLLLMVMD